MELATNAGGISVWGQAARPAAGSLRVVSAPQRTSRPVEVPRPSRQRTQYTLCQASPVARESPTVASSPVVERQVEHLAELLEACPSELTYQDKVPPHILFAIQSCMLACSGTTADVDDYDAGSHLPAAASCAWVPKQQVRSTTTVTGCKAVHLESK